MSVSSQPWLNYCWKKPTVSLWRITSASFAVVSAFSYAKWSPGSFPWHRHYEWLEKPSFSVLYWFRHKVKSSKLNRSNRGSGEPRCSLDWPGLSINQPVSWSGWLQEKMCQGVSAQHLFLLNGRLVKFPAGWIAWWANGQSGHPAPSLVQINTRMGNRPGQGLSWHWLEKVSHTKGFKEVHCPVMVFQ